MTDIDGYEPIQAVENDEGLRKLGITPEDIALIRDDAIAKFERRLMSGVPLYFYVSDMKRVKPDPGVERAVVARFDIEFFCGFTDSYSTRLNRQVGWRLGTSPEGYWLSPPAIKSRFGKWTWVIETDVLLSQLIMNKAIKRYEEFALVGRRLSAANKRLRRRQEREIAEALSGRVTEANR